MRFLEDSVSKRDKRILVSLSRGILVALISLMIVSIILPETSESFAGIVVPSLVTITSLVATFLVLSFNLGDQLPHQIVEKYLLYNRLVWSYLGIQGTFIVIFSLAMLSNLRILNATMPWALGFSIMLTIGFFRKFLARTSKGGTYQEISDKIKVPELSSLDAIEKEKNNPKYDIRESHKAYTLNPTKKSDNSHGTGQKYGILRIDNSKLEKLLEQGPESLTIFKEGYIFDGSDSITTYPVYCGYENNTSIDKSDIEEIISFDSIEGELEWLYDWLTCLRHSAKNSPDRLREDFNFLASEISEIIPKNPSIVTLVLDELSDFFEKEGIDNRKLLSESVFFVNKIESDIAEDPTYLPEVQESLKEIYSNFALLVDDVYSPEYAGAISDVSTQTGIGSFKESFEEEKDPDNLKVYKRAMSSTIIQSREIIDSTVKNYPRNPEYFSKYLRNQTETFVDLFSLYDLEVAEEDLGEEEHKNNILYLIREIHKNTIADIAFQILFFIDNGEIKDNMADLAFQMMEETNIRKYPNKQLHLPEECYPYYNFVRDTPTIIWPDYFSIGLSSSIREIGSQLNFPKGKYELLYLFYLQLNEKDKEVLGLEDFEISSESIENFSFREFKKWFDYSKEEFRVARNELAEYFNNSRNLSDY